MSNRIRGSKRLQIIQNWLNGRDDPDFEVFPTKTEGRYMVKPRKTPIRVASKQSDDVEHNDDNDESENDNNASGEDNESTEEIQEETVKTIKPINRAHQTESQKPRMNHCERVNRHAATRNEDPTISLEILNQLRILGDEIRAKRESKAQKRLIKEVVQKQISKQHGTRPRYIPQYMDEDVIDEPPAVRQEIHVTDAQIQNPPSLQTDTMQQIMRRRNNIFSDVC